jgi:hypothetical protein
MKKSSRISQAELIVKMLRKARTEDRAVGVSELMMAGVAHFTTRIMELRQRGFGIENEMWRNFDGRVCSQYWLTRDPEQDSE